MNKSLSLSSSSSERTCHASEESSWTMYLEDFFANHNQDNHDSSIFDEETFPEVSDAASLVGKKSLESKPAIGLLSTNQKSYNSRLSFKKRQTKEAMVDDALEDTASSPANSPMVYDVNVQFQKNTRQKVEVCTSQGKSSALYKGRETGNLGFLGCENDTIELKQSGLCFVPVSMVVNFPG
ncbi:hypothetical protein K2173_010770 [Erythroxylum novogranatense]|uniref:Uncharacterized protein n=1 Tax=Erythroxylum novogranatense TaxID=1862640 RepID=A0AAV8SS12_9ROSI|nr:hypothetical protein K2173_010770 [Erythroxylum novogranatense]